MGRKYKSSKGRPVSKIEEKEKIKESILEIFRQRQFVSDEGGALLVGPDTNATSIQQTLRASSKPYGSQSSQNEKSYCSDGSMTGIDKDPFGKRRKRENKSKQKTGMKTSTAVTKHIKVAQGLTNNQPQLAKGLTEENIGSLITHSRMTQRLGLIRHGKKSTAALRGHLQVPSHIQQQTNKDLQKLVDHRENTTLHRSFKPEDVQSCSSSGLNSDPVELSKRETVRELMSALKPVNRAMYSSKNFATETKEELLKLLKQNALGSTTPIVRPIHRQVTTKSIQRSLLSQFSPENEKHEKMPSFITSSSYGTMSIQHKDKQNTNAVHSMHQTDWMDQRGKNETFDLREVDLLSKNKCLGTSTNEFNDKKMKSCDYSKREHIGKEVSMPQNNKSSEIDRDIFLSGKLSADTIHSEVVGGLQQPYRDNSSGNYNFELLLKGAQLLQHKETSLQTSALSLSYDHSTSHVGRFVSKVADHQDIPVQPDNFKELMHQHTEKAACNSDKFAMMDLSNEEFTVAQILQQNLLEQKEKSHGCCQNRPSESDDMMHSGSPVTQFGKYPSRSNGQRLHYSSCSGSQHAQIVKHHQSQDDFMPSFHGDYYKEASSFQIKNRQKRDTVESMDILDYANQETASAPDDIEPFVKVATPDSTGSLIIYMPHSPLSRKPRIKPFIDTPGSGPKLYPRHLY